MSCRCICRDRNIQPGVGDWSSHRPWIQSRLKQELITLSFGVAKGDQIEMQRDPVVQRALAIVGAKR